MRNWMRVIRLPMMFGRKLRRIKSRSCAAGGVCESQSVSAGFAALSEIFGRNRSRNRRANTIINSLLGQRAEPKPKINPDQPAGVVEKSNSVSHLSYDSQLGNLIALRMFYANVPAYKPNETDIKLVEGFDASNRQKSKVF